MNCPYCNVVLQSGSMFCMHCGKQIITTDKKFVFEDSAVITKDQIMCSKCGKTNPMGSGFCSTCGSKLKDRSSISLNKKLLPLAISVLVIIIFLVIGITYKNSLKSPIEGVSKKVYVQGQTFLRQMDTENVEKSVARYLDNHGDENVNEIYKHIPGVNFKIELGKNPTVEEVYYSDLIDKFWMAKATCYCHRSLMGEYVDNDNEGVQFALTLYKGIVSDFETGIKSAERQLDTAKNLSDMEDAYEILDNIWKRKD